MATSKSKRGRKVLILLLILLVVGGLSAAAFLRKREPILTIQTEKVARRNLTELVVANGRIYPVFQVKISPEVSGEIIALPVKEGQKVKKGDLLVSIKPDMYVASRTSSEASYKSAMASKVSAEANLARAEKEYRRFTTLFNTNLVSESAFQDTETSYLVNKSQAISAGHQVEMAQAALKRADEDLLKTTILAPLDGTVSRLNSQLGERVVGTAMMAGTEIMTIADLNEMEARVDVGEIDVPLMRVGETARLEVDAFKDRKFTGVVTEIANSSKSAGTGGGSSTEATKFEVRIRIKDKETFLPGMSVTADVETRYQSNVLAVPIASVTTRLPKEPGRKPGESSTNAPARTNEAPATTNATVASGSTNVTGTVRRSGDAPKPIEVVFIKDGDVARMLPVKRGISDENYTEITEGLKEGQEVVSGGYKAISKDLEDGKKIKIGPSALDKGKPDEKK